MQLPFSTREPEVYQAEIVIRAGDSERRLFVARNGNDRRVDYDVGTGSQRSVIRTDREIILSFDKKTYVERPLVPAQRNDSSSLAEHLLHERDYTEFRELGRDGDVRRYSARINESDASDVVIHVDEKIGLPTIQEFYSVAGNERRLLYSFEMRNFRPEAGPSLFQVPDGFKKTSAAARKTETR